MLFHFFYAYFSNSCATFSTYIMADNKESGINTHSYLRISVFVLNSMLFMNFEIFYIINKNFLIVCLYRFFFGGGGDFKKALNF